MKAFPLRLDEDVYRQLRRYAKVHDLSMNRSCERILKDGLQTHGGAPSSLVQSLQKVFPEEILGIALFGSQARGTATSISDTDLLIVLRPSCPIRHVLYAQWEDSVEAPLKMVSPHFVHLPRDPTKAGSLWLEVALEAKILFDPDEELHHTVMDLRHRIARGEYQRRTSYGIPYWKRGPKDAKS